ncbi:MAG: GGDEF domain-containing phosphodiesterase [Eubacteriales bacterium]
MNESKRSEVEALSSRLKQLEEVSVMDKAIIECAHILLLNHDNPSESIKVLLKYVCEFYDAEYACIYERNYHTKTSKVSAYYETQDYLFDLNRIQPFQYERHTKFSDELLKHDYLYLEDGDELLNTELKDFSTELYCGNVLAIPIKMDQVLMDVVCVHGLKKHLNLFDFIVTVSAFIMNNIQIKMSNKKLEDLVNYDTLTGLCTEYRFKRNVRKLLMDQADKKYSIVTINIDNFKYINSIYGYEAGTKVLVLIADLIKEAAKYSDLVARCFADTFLLIVESEGIESFIQRQSEIFTIPDGELKGITSEDFTLSYSIGYYDIIDDTLDISYMIDCATIARNVGRKTTGYTLHKFTEEMRMAQSINGEITATMYDAVLNKEFVMYYQPKVELSTYQIIGAEALVRWMRRGKIMAPNDFIPLFEKNGFIEKLDYYVLESVCQFISDHKSESIPRISVNLSGITLMKEDLMNQFNEILKAYDIRQNQIVVEVTETAFALHFDEAAERIAKLREAGFAVAMDDFGAGVSSLNRLKDITIDLLKMDRGFITDSIDSNKGTAIIRNVLNMATELELESVGEGIETEEQLHMLQEMGCDIGQGYYFARPLPPEEFLEKLRENRV